MDHLMTAHERDDVFTIVLDGELDVASAERVHRRILELVEGRTMRAEVKLDLHTLTFLDSTGIRMLITLTEHFRSHGRRLQLVNVNGLPLRVLTLVPAPELTWSAANDPLTAMPAAMPSGDLIDASR